MRRVRGLSKWHEEPHGLCVLMEGMRTSQWEREKASRWEREKAVRREDMRAGESDVGTARFSRYTGVPNGGTRIRLDWGRGKCNGASHASYTFGDFR